MEDSHEASPGMTKRTKSGHSDDDTPPTVNEELFASLLATISATEFVEDMSLILQGAERLECSLHADDDVSEAKIIEQCRRCGGMLDSCFCHELFCRKCMKCAVDCLCRQSWVKVRVCWSCTYPEEPINLYVQSSTRPPWSHTPIKHAWNAVEMSFIRQTVLTVPALNSTT